MWQTIYVCMKTTVHTIYGQKEFKRRRVAEKTLLEWSAMLHMYVVDKARRLYKHYTPYMGRKNSNAGV